MKHETKKTMSIVYMTCATLLSFLTQNTDRCFFGALFSFQDRGGKKKRICQRILQ